MVFGVYVAIHLRGPDFRERVYRIRARGTPKRSRLVGSAHRSTAQMRAHRTLPVWKCIGFLDYVFTIVPSKDNHSPIVASKKDVRHLVGYKVTQTLERVESGRKIICFMKCLKHCRDEH